LQPVERKEKENLIIYSGKMLQFHSTSCTKNRLKVQKENFSCFELSLCEMHREKGNFFENLRRLA
jgi:hypothetical protein